MAGEGAEVMVATHNQASIEATVALMGQLGIDPGKGGVYFGQLLGMADHLTFTLVRSRGACLAGWCTAVTSNEQCALRAHHTVIYVTIALCSFTGSQRLQGAQTLMLAQSPVSLVYMHCTAVCIRHLCVRV